MLSSDFPDKISSACLKHYSRLPKSGKPVKGKEWSLLSAILITTSEANDPCVVAMATGSKCIGRSKLSEQGDILNDSHAEVLARRAFLRYLYYQVELVTSGQKSDILERAKNADSTFSLKPGVKFHMYTSHTPCGDASIFPKKINSKRKAEGEKEEETHKRLKLEDTVLEVDIHRTGAKCVSEGEQDPKGEGVEYHTLGALRTKPGRGDPTLSMSCSDKMAKWNVCGLQGALLARLLERPVYLDTITVGNCPYCPEAMTRALIGRIESVQNLPEGYRLNSPQLFHSSSFTFECSRTLVEEDGANKVVPCSASIIWSNVPFKPLEVSVNGKRQGVTSKTISKPSARLSACKAELFETFCELNKIIHTDDKSDQKCYEENKNLSVKYQESVASLHAEFKNWTKKPKTLLQFMLSPQT